MNDQEPQGEKESSPVDPLKQAKAVTMIVYALQAGSGMGRGSRTAVWR